MPNDRDASELSHLGAGRGVERTVTEARGGVQRGVSKILGISTLLAVVAIGAIWFLAAHPERQSTSNPSVPNLMAQTGRWASEPRARPEPAHRIGFVT